MTRPIRVAATSAIGSVIVAISTLLYDQSVATAAVCKLSIILDRSGSLSGGRANGQTRCFNVTEAVKRALTAYRQRDVYDMRVGQIVSTSDVYDLNCPALSNRLVSIWVLQQTSMIHLTGRPTGAEDGFVSVELASSLLLNRPDIFQAPEPMSPNPVFRTEYHARDDCSGLSAIAQTMCLAARELPPGPPPAGELRFGLVFTDGGENASDMIALQPWQEPRCRLPGEPADPIVVPTPQGWAATVMNEYQSRGVRTSGFVLTSATGNSPSPDLVFFQALAAQTAGTAVEVSDDQPIESGADLADTDSDGIPDYRDSCAGTSCANDSDHDGIVDSDDACPFALEDGNGILPSDGCPDRDADGIPNDADPCPTLPEDGLGPFPANGCPFGGAPVPATSLFSLSLAAVAFLGLGAGALILRARRR